MKIISDFKDFYDFNTIYDSDDSIKFHRVPEYHKDNEELEHFIDSIPIRRAQNLLKKFKRWSRTYSKPMEGKGYYMTFKYHVIGIFPYVYIVPLVIVNTYTTSAYGSEVEYFYKDPTLPFNTQALTEIGDKYGMKFIQYKGKGPNKKPLHRVVLRKFTDIESSFFYLEEYISPEDIVIDTPENLKTPDFRELFHMIKAPVFYMSSYSCPKHDNSVFNPWSNGEWRFVINPDFSEIKYISLKPFIDDGNIYNRIEEFIIESNTIQIPEPSNEVKIEAAGFDKVTSFRKPKEEKKRKNVKENKPNNIHKPKRGE